MKKFAIRNDYLAPGVNLTYLYYDNETKEYHMTMPDGVDPNLMPPVPGAFAERGLKEIGHEWRWRWVKERLIIPHVKEINGIPRSEYDSIFFLERVQGRNDWYDQDYLVPMECSAEDEALFQKWRSEKGEKNGKYYNKITY